MLMKFMCIFLFPMLANVVFRVLVMLCRMTIVITCEIMCLTVST